MQANIMGLFITQVNFIMFIGIESLNKWTVN